MRRSIKYTFAEGGRNRRRCNTCGKDYKKEKYGRHQERCECGTKLRWYCPGVDNVDLDAHASTVTKHKKKCSYYQDYKNKKGNICSNIYCFNYIIFNFRDTKKTFINSKQQENVSKNPASTLQNLNYTETCDTTY